MQFVSRVFFLPTILGLNPGFPSPLHVGLCCHSMYRKSNRWEEEEMEEIKLTLILSPIGTLETDEHPEKSNSHINFVNGCIHIAAESLPAITTFQTVPSDSLLWFSALDSMKLSALLVSEPLLAVACHSQPGCSGRLQSSPQRHQGKLGWRPHHSTNTLSDHKEALQSL